MLKEKSQKDTKINEVPTEKSKPEPEPGRTVCLEYIDKPNNLSPLKPTKRGPGETAHGFVVGVTGVPGEVSDSEVAIQYNKLAIWSVPECLPWSDIAGLPEGSVVRYRKD